jgi:hypothetical protein
MFRIWIGQNVVAVPQKGIEKRRSPEQVISPDKAAVLWMYCREIAPFETPTFSKNVGELITRAMGAPHKRQARPHQIKTPREP